MNGKCHHRGGLTIFFLKTLGCSLCVVAVAAALLLPPEDSSANLAAVANSSGIVSESISHAADGAVSLGGPVIFAPRQEMDAGIRFAGKEHGAGDVQELSLSEFGGALFRPASAPATPEPRALPISEGSRLGGVSDEERFGAVGTQTASTPSHGGRTFFSNAVRPLTEGPPGLPVVTVGASPAGAGTVQLDGVNAVGEEVTVTATANEGFAFAGWMRGGDTVNMDASYTFTVTQPQSLVAFFTQEDADGNGMEEGQGGTNLVWQHTNGDLALWEIEGAALVQSGVLTDLVPAADSRVAGLADFNQDGQTDILFQKADGSLVLWLMDGLQQSGEILLQQPDPGWRAVAVADFNADGNADILLQHPEEGLLLWEMDQTDVVSQQFLNEPVPDDWHFAGVSDFNGNGHLDILWEHGATDAGAAFETEPPTEKLFQWFVAMLLQELTAMETGQADADEEAADPQGPRLTLWRMQGLELDEAVGLHDGEAVSPGWRVAQVIDLDGAGNTDIYWLRRDGEVAVWHLTGLELAGTALLEEPVAAGWQMVGVQLPEPVSAE